MARVEAAATSSGNGAATILATAIAYAVMGILAFAGDAVPAIAQGLTFWKPTGALSGVTTVAIAIWLAAWWLLSLRWRGRSLNMAWIGAASAALTAVGLLLTFPPFMDLLQGK
jgi:hypothetical protein